MINNRNSHRRGFTMVELMVVIGVIVLLLSLTVGAMYNYIVGARESATAATIAKVHHQLQERVAGFRQMDFTDAAQRYSAANPGTSVELAEVIVRKFRMKRAFPQNLTEAYTNDPQRFSALSTIAPPSTPPAGYVSKYESGIVLYALLTNGETFGAASVDDDLFSSSEVRISAETANLPCLVDAWGEPLRFYRWPTRLFRPNGISTTLPLDRKYARLLVSNLGSQFGADGVPGRAGSGGVQGEYGSDDIPNCGPDGAYGIAGVNDDNDGSTDNLTELGWPGSDDYEPLSVDPDDPLMLLSGLLTTTALITLFEQGGSGTIDLSKSLHTPFTYNPMLVVSAGPDRQLGLQLPNDDLNFGYLACPTSTTAAVPELTDNITNLNLSSSGK